MPDTRTEWEAYIAGERTRLVPILVRHGYTLEALQPHLSGERHLMQAVTTASGKKLILLAMRADGVRAVIKATSDPAGKKEIEHERECRHLLHKIDFAYELFTSPEELLFTNEDGFLISIQRFVEQEKAFLARTLTEQFGYALGAFKAQEGAHATTYKHQQSIRAIFGSMNVADYLATFDAFVTQTKLLRPADESTIATLTSARVYLAEHAGNIERYENFLTHTDFVPHNIRIKDGQIYLLDYSSLRFGNKYEGWARFVNFMALHNPPLAAALTEYVALNRSPEESVALEAMRAYRLGEMVTYHSRNLSRAEGDLYTLTEGRVAFWGEMLGAHLRGENLPPERIQAYRDMRDSLRSEDEKTRQVGLN